MMVVSCPSSIDPESHGKRAAEMQDRDDEDADDADDDGDDDTDTSDTSDTNASRGKSSQQRRSTGAGRSQ